jgi:hypothetical protein
MPHIQPGQRYGFRVYGPWAPEKSQRCNPRRWQNPFAERVIRSIRRECLDHISVINERHLRRLLRRYLASHNATGRHQALHYSSPYPLTLAGWPTFSGRSAHEGLHQSL